MSKFCILAEPRSGTTFFNRSINFHPEVRSFGEVLPGHRSSNGFHHYWLEQIKHDPARISLQYVSDVFRDYIRDIFAGCDETGVGFDIKYYQLEWKSDFLHVLARERFRIIHIIRTILLKRHVSWLLHQPNCREAANRPMHATSYTPPVRVNVPEPRRLVEILREYERRVGYYKRLISENFPHVDVLYEEMIDPKKNFLRPRVSRRVFNLLDVPMLEEAPCNPLRKMNPNLLRLSINNYHEVVESLLATPYERFLDDPRWDRENLDLHKELFMGTNAPDPALRIKHLRNAVSVNPEDTEPYFQMGLQLYRDGRPNRALDMFGRVFSLCSDPEMQAYYEYAAAELFPEAVANA